ncbi:MAG: Dabb family protein [Pirellulales bacterium]
MAKSESQLAHIVYFTLKDRSPDGVERQLDACRKYLTGHDGVVYFSVGTLSPDLAREVNDREFDVGLHVVFRDRAAHDVYQSHPRHVQFIDENKAHWAKVRVFDADIR